MGKTASRFSATINGVLSRSCMNGYNQSNPEVTYDRLHAMGNNGVQEPVTGFAGGKLIGSPRLYENGVFTRHGREDGKALFCMGAWRGLEPPGTTENGGEKVGHGSGGQSI